MIFIDINIKSSSSLGIACEIVCRKDAHLPESPNKNTSHIKETNNKLKEHLTFHKHLGQTCCCHLAFVRIFKSPIGISCITYYVHFHIHDTANWIAWS